jgi:hypothetical protein
MAHDSQLIPHYRSLQTTPVVPEIIHEPILELSSSLSVLKENKRLTLD